MLNFYEVENGVESPDPSDGVESPSSLKIIYYPSNEQDFKEALLQTKKAYVLCHITDGTTTFNEWNASNFKTESNLKGNLYSGYLRDWKEKGIFKVEISTNRDDLRQ